MKADKEVNPHHKTAYLHVNRNKNALKRHISTELFSISVLSVCLVHGYCSSTAVYGSASQSIHVELAAHWSSLLHQRQPSALLLHTDV